MTAAALWRRIRRFGALRSLALLIGIGGFAYLWIASHGRFMEATVWSVPLVILLLVLSLPWRTISARTVARFFFIGFGPIFFATVVTQALLVASPLQRWVNGVSLDWERANIGWLGDVHITIWAPITEEIWKVVPLLVLLWWGRSHLRTQGGPLDFAILAAATGAGMGCAEDIFQINSAQPWSTPQSPLLGLGVGVLYLALVVNPFLTVTLPVIAGNFTYAGILRIFDPSLEQLPAGALWAGHGVFPAAVGLAIGFAVLGRRRLGTPLVWILPVVVWLWAIWDHFVGNWYSSTTCGQPDAPTLCGLTGLDLNGGLFPLVVIAGFGLAMFVSARVVRHHADADPVSTLTRAQLSTASYRGTGATWPIRLVRDWLHYLVLRSRVAFGWFQMEAARPDARTALAEPVAASRLRGAQLGGRLRNEPLPALPPPAQARLDSLIPRI